MGVFSKEGSESGWQWYDFISSYRFWALVFASFFIASTNAIVGNMAGIALANAGFEFREFGTIFAIGAIGSYIGALCVVYFARQRIKLLLIIFSGISIIGSLGFFSLSFSGLFLPTFMMMLIRLGEAGFLLSTAVAIVGGKPGLRSFAVTYSIVFIWTRIGYAVTPAFLPLIVGETPQFWIAMVPAIIATLLLLPIPVRLFSESPTHSVTLLEGPVRTPIIVFLMCSLIPFYVYFWLFKRPGELRSISPDIAVPTGRGAILLALFAPFLFPLWMYEVRSQLKKLPGHAGQLDDRSSVVMGIIAFILPTVGAALSQSDSNAFTHDHKDAV